MTLTRDNMFTVQSGIHCDLGALIADICQMDESQLERYMRMAFTGTRDSKFLPEEFWHGFSLDPGRTQLEVGSYFGGQIYHSILDASKSERPTIVDLNRGRTKFVGVLKRLMQESLDDTAPSDGRKTLASILVNVAFHIRFSETTPLYPIDHQEIHSLGLQLN